MRTWRVRELGEPADVMALEHVDAPQPGASQVLLAVDALGLNFPDLLQVRGGYQNKPKLPFTPGGEIAGTVVTLGEGVTEHAVGDRVLWMGTGGLSEQVLAPARSAFPLPTSMPATKAAALLTNYGTTWFALHERAQLHPGEVLLVHAGAGGVGSAAIQLGKAAGAMVIATAGGPAKKQVLSELGADVAIDYLAEDFVDVVKDVTDGRGADVIYDPVGGDTLDRSRKVIGWDGRLLIIGFTSGRIADVPTNHVLLKNYAVLGVHWGGSLGRNPDALRQTYDALIAQWQRGAIDPLIGGELRFDQAAEGLTRLGARASVGKLVVLPAT